MTVIHISYAGDLHTCATHQSGNIIATDAPLDNGGKGEAFSPTDLLATALGTCCCTVMGKKVESMGLELEVRAEVVKTMIANPRRVDEIHIDFYFAHPYEPRIRTVLEAAAHSCPVAKSLAFEVRQTLVFHYPET